MIYTKKLPKKWLVIRIEYETIYFFLGFIAFIFLLGLVGD